MTAGELSSSRDTLLRMTNAYEASQAIHVAATPGIADLLEDGQERGGLTFSKAIDGADDDTKVGCKPA